MKIQWAATVLIMSACGAAQAADHSAAISADGSGIDLYSITDKGAHLVKGSPYVLPQPGVAYPLSPELVKINSTHNFVYAVYESVPLQSVTNDIMVVGLKVTDKGLVYQWSKAFNVDPDYFAETTLSTGAHYAVVFGEPFGTGYGAQIYQESGKETDVNIDSLLPPLTSVVVDENGEFYYSCHLSADPPSVGVFNLATNTVLFTSTDPVFVASECPTK